MTVPDSDVYARIESALFQVLDEDEAADLTLMLKEEPESVMDLLYRTWPGRHDECPTCGGTGPDRPQIDEHGYKDMLCGDDWHDGRQS